MSNIGTIDIKLTAIVVPICMVAFSIPKLEIKSGIVCLSGEVRTTRGHRKLFQLAIKDMIHRVAVIGPHKGR